MLANRTWQGYVRLSCFALKGEPVVHRRLSSSFAAVAALCALSETSAATTAKKSAKPVIAAPVVSPAVATPPSPGGFMVPKAVVLRPTTPAETEANAVWNIRAALNVAALQCQYSPYLATVKTYNAMLKHHSEELSRAQATLVAHFKRYDGAKAINSFDQYTTRTYNSYSTLDAQYSFCEAAGRVGREVLATPRDKLGAEAIRRAPEIREAFAEKPLAPALAVIPMTAIAIGEITNPDL